MRDDPARQRIERIVFDDEQASTARQPRGQVHDRFVARLQRNVVHDVGKNDQTVVAMQFVEPVGKQAAFAQRRCNLVQTRRGHVVTVDRILGRCWAKATDSAPTPQPKSRIFAGAAPSRRSIYAALYSVKYSDDSPPTATQRSSTAL